jgi:hypothetical protein
MSRRVTVSREEVADLPLVQPTRPFDVKIHWTAGDDGSKRVTVAKVMAGDWTRAIDLAMRAVRFDKTVPLDAKVLRIVP